MFHFIGENLWLTVTSLESMQFPKSTSFDKGKLGFMNFECKMVFIKNPKSILK